METIYSSVTFKKHQQREDEGAESPKAAPEEVVYSTLAFSSPAGPRPSNLQGPADPADPPDPPAGARTKVIASKAWRKDRLLVFSLCALLIAVTFIAGVLYVLWQISHEEVVQGFTELQVNMTRLERENTDLLDNNTNLISQLSERNRSIEQLQAEMENLKEELLVLKGKAERCADDWKPFSGKCYYFSTDEKTWTASRDACVAQGGDLVIINSKEKKDFLTSNLMFGRMDYWIGLTDAVKENEWRWLDGTKFKEEFLTWTGNEPDNWKGKKNSHPDGEDCAVMELPGNALRDAFCDEPKTHKYICEAKAGM